MVGSLFMCGKDTIYCENYIVTKLGAQIFFDLGEFSTELKLWNGR
jgi:hypothetical protein